MSKSTSSFKELPNQIEWAFPLLIGYATYLFMVSAGAVSALCVITALILLNGWISSRATSNLYSDLLLAIDVIGMCFYFCMVLNLSFSRNQVLPSYWLYSSGLCISYFFWDLAIFPLVGKENWHNRFRFYVILMALSCVAFIGLYYLHKKNILNEYIVLALGSSLWLALLCKWHWDKMRSGKQTSNG